MPPSIRHALLFLTVSVLAHAAPGFESISPAGGQVGTQFEVRVAGKGLDKGAPQAWCSNAGVKITPGAKAGLWTVVIGQDAAPGPCLVRFYHDEGATPPRIFEVGTLEEVLETEPNDAFKDVKAAAAAPAVPRMNTTCNGALAKDADVDIWALRVQKGRAITLRLHGYALGSPMDPAMRLLDARGVEVAASHDTHNLDPEIRHTPASDGVLYVQVFAFVHPPQADVAFKGSANHVYRLHVTDSEQAPAVPATASAPQTPPFVFTGIVPAPAAEAVHLLTARKGDDLQVTVQAKAIHSPLEAVLRIESAEGKILAQSDDAQSITSGNSASALDPALRWKAPADGTYKMVIGDRFQNGGPAHRYGLSVQPWKPSVSAQLDTHAYRMEAGKIEEVKLTVKFDGTYPQKLRAHVSGLPPGVTAGDVDVPEKGGEVKVPLRAAADATPAQVPISIVLLPAADSSVAASEPPPAVATATYPIPFAELRGDLLVVSDGRPWLTVAKGPASAAKSAGGKDAK